MDAKWFVLCLGLSRMGMDDKQLRLDYNYPMRNLLLLCIYAISGTCATPDGIFAQVDTINDQQKAAHLIASKSDYGKKVLYIDSAQSAFTPGLTISMEDLRTHKMALIEIDRGSKPLTRIEIMRLPLSDGDEDVLLEVSSCEDKQDKSVRYASAYYRTKTQNVHSIPDPQATLSPFLLNFGIPHAEISCELPKSTDAHTYTLVIAVLLTALPRFTIFCKTTKQEDKLFELVYHPSAVIPQTCSA